jgi:hypothetical protein
MTFTIGAERQSLSDRALLVCVVDEAVTFAFDAPDGDIEVAIDRAPAGSTALAPEPGEGAFVPDLPGRYDLRVLNGSVSTTRVHLAVFPVAALTHPRIPEIGRKVLPEGHFRRHAADGGRGSSDAHWLRARSSSPRP